MGKTYTIIFNSAIANDTFTYSERFYYDWSRIPEGKYKVVFTFVNGQVGQQVPTFLNAPNLFMDLGQGAYTQIASSNVPTDPGIREVFSPNFIGCLETRTLATSGGVFSSYYYAGLTTNPPLYIDNRPRNNSIQILIYTNTEQGAFYTPLIGAYTLTLQFEKLD